MNCFRSMSGARVCGRARGCVPSSRVKLATPLGFALKFIVVFGILTAAFEASRGTAFERYLIEDVILIPAANLINVMSPHEPVRVIGRTISSTSSNLRVTRGCEGIEMFLMLIAAIAAFPASIKRRVQGLLFGSVLAYV